MPIAVDFEHSDIKRESILNNFFYLNLRLRFEGFDNEL